MTETSSRRSGGGGAGRHRAREVALQVLYAIDLAGGQRPVREDRRDERREEELVWEWEAELAANDDDLAMSEQGVFDRIVQNFDVPTTASAFARELVTAVVARRDEIDERIGLHARNWRVSRMAAVDRNVLRLAVYELKCTATPVAVVIDEAVDLARRFGSDSSPSFVNGVLDAVAREVRAA